MDPFPKTLQKAVAEMDDFANVVMRRGDYLDAILIHQARFDVIKAAEEIGSKRFHKGGPLHMTGLCYLIAERPQEALKCFAASHVEDVLSDGAEGARPYAAHRVLRQGYIISETDLDAFDSTILGVTEPIPDPFSIVELHEKKIGASLGSLAKARPRFVFPRHKIQEIDSIQPDADKRVFVGGSFDNILWLQRIENVVLELDYYAILAINFEQPAGVSTDDFTKQLLSMSKHAVFELSVVGAAGHYVEMAHAKELGTDSLGVYQSLSKSEHRFSQEVDWLSKKPYNSLEDLKRILSESLGH